ncbi:MAG: ChuX/HutX family heme-like substrate-binding protein, partial [Methylococcales bacterium]
MLSNPETLNPYQKPNPVELKSLWQLSRKENPHLRIRDFAGQLKVSEAELVAASCGDTVTRLAANWGELIKHLPKLGKVMALTRNNDAVHEKYGQYQKISIDGPMGLVLDEHIDLRLFLNHWHLGFAVCETATDKQRHSLQFFDRDGSAIHKIYLQDDSHIDAYHELLENFAAANQGAGQAVSPYPPKAPDRPDSDIDQASLIEDWRNMLDTHDFFGMLKKHHVGRTQAFRLVDRHLACRMPVTSVEWVLNQAAATQTPIMVFIGNPGVIQIHTGCVKNITKTGPWLNVLDENFNMHLRLDSIDSAWLVRKPTTDGIVTSLEIFDAAGENIAQFFGKRKPG